ncbi:10657_t:CDS:2, partial [Diversispora eburnea]
MSYSTKNHDKEKVSQQSNITICNEENLELIMRNGVCGNDSVLATSPISNEKGNLVQVNLTDKTDMNDTIMQDQFAVSPRVIHEQDKFQELLQELSTPIKGEPTEINDDEGIEGLILHSLVQLYQKVMKARLKVIKVDQEEILCWYYYTKGCEDRVKEIMENDHRLNRQQAMSQ